MASIEIRGVDKAFGPTHADTHVYCEFCGSQICAVFGERRAFRPGETIWLQPKTEAVHLFDSATRKVLN